MYNCEAVVSERERERVRHMCMSSRECARKTIRGKEEEPQLYAPRSDCRDCDAKNRPTCHGRCWMVATGCAVFVPGM